MWMNTFRGEKVDPFNLRPEQVSLVDIAQSLSNLCRFTGHVEPFYSVAQHSYIMSQLIQPEYAAQALFHDSPEIYTNDISRPVKRNGIKVWDEPLGEYIGFKVLEERIFKTIITSLGIPLLTDYAHNRIGHIDIRLCMTEARDLMPRTNLKEWEVYADGYRPYSDLHIVPVPPEEARRQFYIRYNELHLSY